VTFRTIPFTYLDLTCALTSPTCTLVAFASGLISGLPLPLNPVLTARSLVLCVSSRGLGKVCVAVGESTISIDLSGTSLNLPPSPSSNADLSSWRIPDAGRQCQVSLAAKCGAKHSPDLGGDAGTGKKRNFRTVSVRFPRGSRLLIKLQRQSQYSSSTKPHLLRLALVRYVRSVQLTCSGDELQCPTSATAQSWP